MFGWLRRRADDLFGAPRSGRWPLVRREHLAKEPACIACGPELELDPDNLVTLCADPCHFAFGHLLDWKLSNPHVREDAADYKKRFDEART